MRTAKTTWLLTGVTGFLGKVLLEELMRRRAELGIARVLVLIRPRGPLSGSERFRRDVVGAACFATLPVNWTDCVTVLDGDLSLPDLGLPDSRVLAELTHVAHCAASIEFDLPAREAAAANIDATMHLLEAVRPLQRLRRFVYVSTAYVTPHPADGAAIPEALVPLPAPAEELYDAIHSGRFSDVRLVSTWLE